MFRSPSRTHPVPGYSEHVHVPFLDTQTTNRGDSYTIVLPAPIASANRPSEHVYCDPGMHALTSTTHAIVHIGPAKLTLSSPSGSP